MILTKNIHKHLNTIVDAIKSKIKKDNSDPVKDAERKLKLNFSPEFKRLVKDNSQFYRAGTILGLSAVVKITNTYRQNIGKSFPQDMYVVANLGIDGIVMLQDESGAIFEYFPHSTISSRSTLQDDSGTFLECNSYQYSTTISKAFCSLSEYIQYLQTQEPKRQ